MLNSLNIYLFRSHVMETYLGGTGDVYHGDRKLSSVTYSIRTHSRGGTGVINPTDPAVYFNLQTIPLTLHLENNKRVDFLITQLGNESVILLIGNIRDE